jgi:hypothetical protein
VTTIKHYDPIGYYEKLIELSSHAASLAMLRRRLQTSSHRIVGYVHRARTARFRSDIVSFRHILEMLRSDSEFLAFHEGRTTKLPEFYRRISGRMLGHYAELLTPADRTPDLSPADPRHHHLTIEK